MMAVWEHYNQRKKWSHHFVVLWLISGQPVWCSTMKVKWLTSLFHDKGVMVCVFAVIFSNRKTWAMPTPDLTSWHKPLSTSAPPKTVSCFFPSLCISLLEWQKMRTFYYPTIPFKSCHKTFVEYLSLSSIFLNPKIVLRKLETEHTSTEDTEFMA